MLLPSPAVTAPVPTIGVRSAPPAPPPLGADAPRATRAPRLDFERAPFLVIWEVTRACALACVHCRADAIARRDPNELTTAEGHALIDQVRAFGDPPPLLVLTGGDPMWRKDLAPLVAYATSRGLSVALTPSGTAAPTRKRLEELKAAGLSRVAVSLDGPDPATHDGFRGVRGSFDYTRRIIDTVVALDLPLQINSTISRRTLPHLDRMIGLVSELPVTLWAVFFLVQTGRGAALEQIDAVECEQVLQQLADLSERVPFGIKTTEAPHFRRVLWERAASRGQEELRHDGLARAAARRPQLRAPRGVNDGNGFVFVDHVGNICPSGFLPIVCGNVRTDTLVERYRHDPAFLELRNPAALTGHCGDCRFRAVCGGSRSRAYAATGDKLAADPLCVYRPAAREPLIEEPARA